ncbi:MAG TPA: adenylate/guanylate cyclase domain-containing protein, partial [Actinomycetota bacterium]|nr:adenylate/guanylate cyclase domain-containing protein [Actinomycetota bacterium]
VASPAFRTILFTDLQGSTALLNEVGQTEFMLLLTEHDLIIRRALVAAHGREVKHTGDGIMASFDEVGPALTCALAIQDGFAERNDGSAEPALHVRVGIAAGEPVDRGDDLFGATVNLASRICDAAQADQVLVSDQVRDHGAPLGFRFVDAGMRQLKGFAEPIQLFELGRDRPQ